MQDLENLAVSPSASVGDIDCEIRGKKSFSFTLLIDFSVLIKLLI
jgi:hypothetical protein